MLSRGWSCCLIEQITELAGGILQRPPMSLDLHPPYCHLRGLRRRPDGSAGIHRRIFDHCTLLLNRTRCRPSPCDRLSRPRSTTTAPPHAHPSTDDASIPTAGSGRPDDTGPGHARFPRSLHSDQRAWCPALPLRPRHGYAVDLHHDLPGQTCETLPGVALHPATHTDTHKTCTAIQPTSTGLELAEI